MSAIKHIVFDVGQVLVFWDPEIPYRNLIADEEQRRWFLTEVCNGAWNIEQDRGRSWSDAEAVLIDQYPEHKALIRAYRKHWIEMVPHHLEDTVAILKALIDQDMDVTLLTNFNQETFPLAQEKFPFLKLPRGATVSGEVRLLKPDRAIYQHHAKTYDLDPTATLFFDDSQKNVDGARQAGWQAELFASAEIMKRDLQNHGVLAS